LNRRKGRLLQLTSSARGVDGALVAEADASFMIDDFGAISTPA
jgi:hypothetical protein